VDCGIVDELWTDFVKNGKKSPYAFCVYHQEGEVLGFACYGIHALTQSTYDLYWIAVDPRVQGQGVGGDLLDYVEARIMELGGSRIIIETSSTESYRSARKFYLSHNYLQEATLSDFYSPGDHLLFFTKRL
jgi:ribosomal protein S18 acetylase RimI-like enzyme